MNQVKKYFLSSKMWVIFLLPLIVLLIAGELWGLEGKHFYEQKGNSTIKFNVGNPIINSTLFIYIGGWLKTITDFLVTRTTQLDHNIQKRITITPFLTFSILFSFFSYFFAENIFAGEVLYVIICTVIGIGFIVTYFYTIYRGIRCIVRYFQSSSILLFPVDLLNVIFFPFSIWKAQAEVRKLYITGIGINTEIQ